MFKQRQIGPIEHHRKPSGTARIADGVSPFFRRGLIDIVSGAGALRYPAHGPGGASPQISIADVQGMLLGVWQNAKFDNKKRFRGIVGVIGSLDWESISHGTRMGARRLLLRSLMDCEGVTPDDMRQAYGFFVEDRRQHAGLWHLKEHTKVGAVEGVAIALEVHPESALATGIKVYGKRQMKVLVPEALGLLGERLGADGAAEIAAKAGVRI